MNQLERKLTNRFFEMSQLYQIVVHLIVRVSCVKHMQDFTRKRIHLMFLITGKNLLVATVVFHIQTSSTCISHANSCEVAYHMQMQTCGVLHSNLIY